jgi:hypothetical protein
MIEVRASMIEPKTRMIILVSRMIKQGGMKTSNRSYISLAKLAWPQFFFIAPIILGSS